MNAQQRIKKSSKTIFLLTIIALILCTISMRLFVVNRAKKLNAVPILAHEVIHDAPAQALARGDKPDQTLLDHYPGFTLFLTAIYRLRGTHYPSIRILLYGISALTCIIIYVLTRLLTTSAAGLITGLIYAFFPQLLIQGIFILPGPLFALLIALIIGYAELFQRNYEWKFGLALGFLLACASCFDPWIMLYPLAYGMLYMALYIKNSWINCIKLLVIPLLTMLVLVSPWLLTMYQWDSLSLLMRSGGLLFDQSAWFDFIPRSTLKTPFFLSWIALGVSMVIGMIVSYRNKLFMPLHAFMLVSIIIVLIPGADVVYRPALYAIASMYAGAGIVVCLAKAFKLMKINLPWLSDQSWRYR